MQLLFPPKWQNYMQNRNRDRLIQRQALAVYQTIIKTARSPLLYQGDDFLPDRWESRFESLALHLFLFYERMHIENELGPVADKIANIVTHDLEDNLRELGAGDMKIGKKVKATTLKLYGRLDAYWGVFHANNDKPQDHATLQEAQIKCLQRNLFLHGGGLELATQIKFLSYIAGVQSYLGKLEKDDIIQNRISIPNLIG